MFVCLQREGLGTRDVSHPLPTVFRPQTYTTEEFGRKWVGLTNEKKLKVDGSLVKKPSEFMEVMSKKLNFHPVQIIGMLLW